MKALVVKSAFGGYERGTTITDPSLVTEILAGEHSQHVTPTEAEDPPAAPAPATKKSK